MHGLAAIGLDNELHCYCCGLTAFGRKVTNKK